MFDLDDVPIEMKDNSIVGCVLPGNEPHRRRGALGRRGVGEWSFGGHLNQRGMEQVESCGKRGSRPRAIVWLFHKTRRAHDLILVAGVALLNASGKDLSGGHFGDCDASATDLSPEDHRAMAHDADYDGRRLWIVQTEIGRGGAFSRDREVGDGYQRSTTEKQQPGCGKHQV